MNAKSAEAMQNTHDDAQKKLTELHEDPEGRAAAESLSAPWGEKGHQDPAHNGRAAWEEFLKDSPRLLEKEFDGFSASAKSDKALIGAYFDTKDYTSRAPQLRKYAEAGLVPPGDTLTERVRALTGRR